MEECQACREQLPPGVAGEGCMYCGTVLYCRCAAVIDPAGAVRCAQLVPDVWWAPSQHCRCSHWVEEHSKSCPGRAAPCQAWVADIHTYLQSQARAGGEPVRLSHLGLVVKRPAGVGKQQKLLPLLMADARFHWFEAPDESKKAYLAVAVKTEGGQLPEVRQLPQRLRLVTMQWWFI
jgi:hypothetical protein